MRPAQDASRYPGPSHHEDSTLRTEASPAAATSAGTAEPGRFPAVLCCLALELRRRAAPPENTHGHTGRRPALVAVRRAPSAEEDARRGDRADARPRERRGPRSRRTCQRPSERKCLAIPPVQPRARPTRIATGTA